MSGPYIVELLARNGDVVGRQRVEALPIRIGRGYDNDVILDDDYAAAAHAIIEHDGQGRLVLRDLGSLNGVAVDGRRRRDAVLDGDTIVRIGHTPLRVRASDHPVAAELPDRTFHGWEGLLPGAAGGVLVALVALAIRWISDTQYVEYVRYAEALAEGLAGALLWSGAWAFGNRLFGRHARLGRHLFVTGCAAAVLLACALLLSTLAWAFSVESFTRYASHAGIALLAVAIYYHLCTVRPQARVRFRWACAGLAVLASSLVLAANMQRTGRFADELYMAVLMPPQLRASQDHGVDEFMRAAEGMKAGLDRSRGRKPGEDEVEN